MVVQPGNAIGDSACLNCARGFEFCFPLRVQQHANAGYLKAKRYCNQEQSLTSEGEFQSGTAFLSVGVTPCVARFYREGELRTSEFIVAGGVLHESNFQFVTN